MFTSHQESALAHQLLDGLSGIEIGGSAFDPFNIPGCRNVDFTADFGTVFKEEERRLAGTVLPVDLVAPGDQLPFPDESLDYVAHLHVLEHFFDPVAAIKEWCMLRPGGIVYAIVPHAARNGDQHRSRTTLAELLDRHAGRVEHTPYLDEFRRFRIPRSARSGSYGLQRRSAQTNWGPDDMNSNYAWPPPAAVISP
jgi:hypothetical protein